MVDLRLGDSLEVLQELSDNSIDSIVTDPPYGLAFMNKKWDYDIPSVDLWVECLRVLKPGGYLLALGGTRTYHRMAVAIEDAGFEIRDSIHWVYGSGFPKSLNVSKAIDKANGRKFEDRYPLARHIREKRKEKGYTLDEVNSWFGYKDGCQHWERTDKSGSRVPTLADYQVLKGKLGLSSDWDNLIQREEAERLILEQRKVKSNPGFSGLVHNPQGSETIDYNVTVSKNDASAKWEGWGTALKPAHEPIVMARKALSGTVAENVLEYGTGALNIDGCRVEASQEDFAKLPAGVKAIRERDGTMDNPWKNSSDLSGANPANPAGRWPANVIFDEVASEALNQQTKGASRFFASADWSETDWPFFYQAKAPKKEKNAGLEKLPKVSVGSLNMRTDAHAEANNQTPEPAQNHHPTVKPVALMRYLVRLVTPPDGTVLDPFLGSGTTGIAAVIEGFSFVGIEIEGEYLQIAKLRIEHWEGKR